MNVRAILKAAEVGLRKNSPQILVAVGIIGTAASIFLMADARPKALEIIDREERKKGSGLTKKEVAKATWKCYIPVALAWTTSAACIASGVNVSLRRQAAIGAAYAVSEAARINYRDKVVDVVGKKKEEEIRDAIAKDTLANRPLLEGTQVYDTGLGKTLCFDAWCGRYCLCDIEAIRRAANTIWSQILSDGSASLNDFYYEIKLPASRSGDILGWDTRCDKFDLYFSSQLAGEDNTPCLVFDFAHYPNSDFDRYYK